MFVEKWQSFKNTHYTHVCRENDKVLQLHLILTFVKIAKDFLKVTAHKSTKFFFTPYTHVYTTNRNDSQGPEACLSKADKSPSHKA